MGYIPAGSVQDQIDYADNYQGRGGTRLPTTEGAAEMGATPYVDSVVAAAAAPTGGMSKSELMQAETGGRGGINPGMGVYRADGTEIRLGDPDYNPYDYITAKQPAAAPPPVAAAPPPVAVAPPPAIQGGASPKQPTIFNPAAFRPKNMRFMR